MLCSGLRARARDAGASADAGARRGGRRERRAQTREQPRGVARAQPWAREQARAWHGVESAGGRGEVQVAGSFGCPLGENPPPQFGKHLVKRLTYRGKVATFRAMKSTELVRVLITEGRH